jgi:hypothetical protein
VAFLLGCQSGAKVSRYERFNRKPSLETAFGYEAVFGAPRRNLFAGVFQKVEEKIKRRAQLLGRKLSEAKRDRITIQKLKILESIVSEARFEPFKIS